jgi:3-oxoacyl-[acyl-carrier-protein] synthase II
MKRAVITGIGAVTPLGNDLKKTWGNLIKGLSGIGKITRFDPDIPGMRSRIAGELKGFSPEQYLPRKDVLRLDPFIHYASAVAFMAIEDSGIKINSVNSSRTGVIVGSSRGGIMSMEKGLEKHLLEDRQFSAYLMSSSTINMASSYISMRLNIKGPAVGISTACASGATAIGEAMRMIRHGEIDVAIAGGAEAPVCRLAVGGYGTAGALSGRNDNPESASRPFDSGRDGFVIAEGAGAVVLEELGYAIGRGARIYAEVAGYGSCSDAFHQTRPDSEGESAAIKKSVNDAGISPGEVDYINAHATSTVHGDRAETQAIRRVFGSRADDIPVSSCKSMLGHMLGGSGAVETAITALSLKEGMIIPTINLENPDIDCKLNHITSAMTKEIHFALTHSFGFGGVNAVLLLKRVNA